MERQRVRFLPEAAKLVDEEKNWLLELLEYSDAVLVLGVVAAVATYMLRSRIDQADQWWKRVQYALELRRTGNPEDLLIGNQILKMLQPEMPTGDEAFGDHIPRWYRNRSRWRVRRIEAQFVAQLLTEEVSDDLEEFLLPRDYPGDNGTEGLGG